MQLSRGVGGLTGHRRSIKTENKTYRGAIAANATSNCSEYTEIERSLILYSNRESPPCNTVGGRGVGLPARRQIDKRRRSPPPPIVGFAPLGFLGLPWSTLRYLGCHASGGGPPCPEKKHVFNITQACTTKAQQQICKMLCKMLCKHEYLEKRAWASACDGPKTMSTRLNFNLHSVPLFYPR